MPAAVDYERASSVDEAVQLPEPHGEGAKIIAGRHSLLPNEVLTAIRVPKLGGAGWSYQKFHRRAIDWAIVGVAAVGPNGSAPRVGLTNMGMTPLRASAVEQALASGADVRAAADHAPEGTSPPSDTNAS